MSWLVDAMGAGFAPSWPCGCESCRIVCTDFFLGMHDASCMNCLDMHGCIHALVLQFV